MQTEGVEGEDGSYEADEGSNVGPAVLHEGVWPVANHVRDVVVKTVGTWGGGGREKANKLVEEVEEEMQKEEVV